MFGRLAHRVSAIVATSACTTDFVMVDGGDRRPGDNGVASITEITGINMDRVFCRGNKTIVTAEAGLLTDAAVIKCNFPVLCAVTGLAGFTGDDMQWTLANGNQVIVATGAGTNRLVVIKVGDRRPACDRMTGIADHGRGHVRGMVVSTVTRGAGADDFGMIYLRNRDECCGVVTRLANAGAVDMIVWLAFRDHPVMATVTVTQHLLMIDPVNRLECGGVVAGLTDIGRVDVSGLFASGVCVVVAGEAIALYLSMIDCCRDPGIGGMTRTTNTTGRWMRCGFACRIKTIVAACARLVGYDTVVHFCRDTGAKAICRMATTARRDGRNMIDRLTRGNHAIMAAIAGFGDGIKSA